MERLIPYADKAAELLKACGETIGVSESSSGGLVSAALLSVAGASSYYRGGGVIYAPNAFRGLMGLTRDDLDGKRSSTEPYAVFLAGKMREKLRTRWAVCETGASGPSGNPYGDAAGHTCVAVVGDDVAVSRTLETGLTDRVENMYLFAQEALSFLISTLESAKS